MGTSQVTLVWKSAHKYGHGTVSLGSYIIRQFANLSQSDLERNGALAIFIGRLQNQGYL